MVKAFAAITLLAAGALGLEAQTCASGMTLVQDTIAGPIAASTGAAVPFYGRVTIRLSPVPIVVGSQTYGLQPLVVTVAGGAFSACLAPNTTAFPANTFYAVSYAYASQDPRQASSQWNETWSVIASGDPVTISQIRQVTTPAGIAIAPVPLSMLAPNLSATSPLALDSSTGVLSCGGCGAGGSGVWGSITGTLSSQTDLNSALGAKLAAAANLSDLANASTARTNLGLNSAATQPSSAFEPAITAGTTAKYWRGDKSFQTLSTAIYALLSASGPLAFDAGTGAFSCGSCITTNLVSSVFGRTGAVVATSGDYTSDQVTEGVTNVYFTTARARAAFSATAPITITGGVAACNVASGSQPGCLSSADWSTFNGKQAALGFTPLNAASNLGDLGSASAARTNLGLAASATTDTTNASNISSGTLGHARLPALVSGDVPNNAANTSGNAATATALAATPSLCSSGQAPTGILASGNATGCAALGGGASPVVATFDTSAGTCTTTGGTGTNSCTATTGSIVITHNLGTSTPMASAYSGTSQVAVSVTVTSSNVVTITFSGDITGTAIVTTGGIGATGPTGATGPAGSVSTTGSPANGQLAQFSGTTAITTGTSTAVVAAFSGCSGTKYLGADGNCHTNVSMCEPGIGDGLNAITSGTYLQSTCINEFGATYTITGVWCFTDNAGSSTLNVTNGAGTALLTGTITCSNTLPGVAGTQSGTTTIANADGIKFTFVSDGTTKQATWVVAISR